MTNVGQSADEQPGQWGLVALAWTGNGPISQDAWAATLKP